jgi:hypothetical protein
MTIKRRHDEGAYRYLSVEEANALLRSVGFEVGEPQPVYAGQCWLLRATHPTVEECGEYAAGDRPAV